MTTASFPRQVLIVCERDLRTHARSLVRAAATHQPLEWCFDTEFEARVKRGPGARTLFLGESRYARFLRRLTQPAARKNDIVWSLYKQHAFIYSEDVIVDVRATLPQVQAQLQQLRTEARYQAQSVGFKAGRPEGPLIANQYFDVIANHPALARTPSSERDVRRAFADTQYVLGIGWFLMDGWDALMAAADLEADSSGV